MPLNEPLRHTMIEPIEYPSEKCPHCAAEFKASSYRPEHLAKIQRYLLEHMHRDCYVLKMKIKILSLCSHVSILIDESGSIEHSRQPCDKCRAVFNEWCGPNGIPIWD